MALATVALVRARGGLLVALLAGLSAAGSGEAVWLVARPALLVGIVARDRGGAALLGVAAATTRRGSGRRVGIVTAATGAAVGIVAGLKRDGGSSVASGARLGRALVTVGLVACRASRMSVPRRTLMAIGAGTVL
jgi:hypothetical protein